MIAYQLFTWHKSNYTHTFGVKSVGHGIQFKGATNFFYQCWKAEETEIKKNGDRRFLWSWLAPIKRVLGTEIENKNKTTHFIERNEKLTKSRSNFHFLSLKLTKQSNSTYVSFLNLTDS